MTQTTDFPLIDAHAHLTDQALQPQCQRLLKQAEEHGVTHILVNATGPQDWDAVTLLSAQQPTCYAALGLHPFLVDQWTPEIIPQLRQRILNSEDTAKIKAIGEIGLDAWNGRDNLPRQLEALAAQLLLAQELNLPVCLHIRKAWNDFFQLLGKLGIRKLRGLCHNFTASTEILRQVLNLGLMVSYAGPAANPQARRIHEAIHATPLTSMLVETDCPNMPIPQAESPVSLPHHTRYVLAQAAKIKALPEDVLARQLQKNLLDLLAIR